MADVTPLFVGAIWLATAALCSLLVGGGLKVGSGPRTPARPAVRSSGDFVSLPLHGWTQAAGADALAALLDTHPVVVRRVPDPSSERDS